MTDEALEPADAGETSRGVPVEETWAEPDHILQILVETVNVTGAEVAVRLHVGGSVISGTLVSGEYFFISLADELDNSVQGARPLADSYREIAAGYREDAESEEWTESRITYVHLKESYLYASNDRPLIVGLWRGRLTAVDGWGFGAYSLPRD